MHPSSSSEVAMAGEAAAPSAWEPELTSFGLLRDANESAPSALSSLLNRVRSAFILAQNPTPTPTSAPPAPGTSSFSSLQAVANADKAAPRPPKPAATAAGHTDSPPSLPPIVTDVAALRGHSQDSTPPASTAPAWDHTSSPLGPTSSPHRSSRSVYTSRQSRNGILPFPAMLPSASNATVTPATAAPARARTFSANSGMTMVTIDDDLPLDSSPASAAPFNADDATLDMTMAGGQASRSSVPGFPLSRDILADDARSMFSVSVMSESPMSVLSSSPAPATPSHINASAPIAPGSSAALQGLRSNQDVRVPSEGISSSQYWMADDAVKECRECLSPFTAFRRKHHCRLCGQIFCARCASHILPGARFNRPMVARVRVCDQCMRRSAGAHRGHPLGVTATDKLHSSSPERTGTDDHGNSTLPSRSPLFSRSVPQRPNISAPLEAQVETPQAEFAANHLFARSSVKATRAAAVASLLRDAGITPSMTMPSSKSSRLDEEIDALPDVDLASLLQPDQADPRVRLVTGPIARPRGTQEIPSDWPEELGVQVQGACGGSEAAAAAQLLPADTAGAVGMRTASLVHLRCLAAQMLQDNHVSNWQAWLGVLLPLAWQAVARVKPNVPAGDSMDIREYVKVKRLPGGKPTDTSYVYGFVTNKHVATKTMQRSLPLVNARVVIVSFPIAYGSGRYESDTDYVSLDHLVAQEQEYIRVLVRRILALRPHLLIAQDVVSRSAIDLLEAAGVVVAWDFKPSAVQAIARCTQAEIISSIDRFALNPRLGRAAMFDVHTYTLASTAEATKPLMRFEGPNRVTSGTVLLRGEGPYTLRKLKIILHFLVYAARNLYLEERLLIDQGAYFQGPTQPEPGSPDALAAVPAPKLLKAAKRVHAHHSSIQPPNLKGGRLHLPHHTRALLAMYDQIIVDVSACVRIPPPYPLLKLQESVATLERLKQLFDEEEVDRIRAGEQRDALAAKPTLLQQPPAADPENLQGTRADPAPQEPHIPSVITESLSHSPQPLPPGSEQPWKFNEVKAQEPLGPSELTPTLAARPIPDPDRLHPPPLGKLQPSASAPMVPTISNSNGQLPQVPAFSQRSPSGGSTASEGQAGRATLPTSVTNGLAASTSPDPTQAGMFEVPAAPPTTPMPPQCKPKPRAQDLMKVLQNPDDVMRQAEFNLEQQHFGQYLASWEAYLLRAPQSITPLTHQELTVLVSKMSLPAQRPCLPPFLARMTYYGKGDMALGQFLERACAEASSPCPSTGCGKDEILHYHAYAHGGVRVQVVPERFVCPVPGQEQVLLTWTYCKACSTATRVVRVGASWAYSWAKFLALHLYARDRVASSACPHDEFTDHVRYFALRNLAVRVHADAIAPLEVRVPALQLFTRPDTAARIKNETAIAVAKRAGAFWDSVDTRISALRTELSLDRERERERERGNLEKTDADKELRRDSNTPALMGSSVAHGGAHTLPHGTPNPYTPVLSNSSSNPNFHSSNHTLGLCNAVLSDFEASAKRDRAEIARLLVSTYEETPMTKTLPLSSVLRQLQEKVVTWDSSFVDFERHYLAPEREKRPHGQPLKRIFSEKERNPPLTPTVPKEKGNPSAVQTPSNPPGPGSTGTSHEKVDDKGEKREKEKFASLMPVERPKIGKGGMPLPGVMGPPPPPTPASEAPSAAASIEAALGAADHTQARRPSSVALPPSAASLPISVAGSEGTPSSLAPPEGSYFGGSLSPNPPVAPSVPASSEATTAVAGPVSPPAEDTAADLPCLSEERASAVSTGSSPSTQRDNSRKGQEANESKQTSKVEDSNKNANNLHKDVSADGREGNLGHKKRDKATVDLRHPKKDSYKSDESKTKKLTTKPDGDKPELKPPLDIRRKRGTEQAELDSTSGSGAATERGRMPSRTLGTRAGGGIKETETRGDERSQRSTTSASPHVSTRQRGPSHLPSYMNKRPGHLNLASVGSAAAAAARRRSRVGGAPGPVSPGQTKGSPLRHRFSQVEDSSTDPEGKHVRGLVRQFDHSVPDHDRRLSAISTAKESGTPSRSSSTRRPPRANPRADSDMTDTAESQGGRRAGPGQARRVPSQPPSRPGSPSHPRRPATLRKASYNRIGPDRARTPVTGGRVTSGIAQDRRRESQVIGRPVEAVMLRRSGVSGAKVSSMTRHYNRMSKDAEREQSRQRLILAARMRRVQPVTYAQAKVKVFDNVREALVVRDEDSSSSGSEASGEVGSLRTGADADADNEDELSSESSDLEANPLQGMTDTKPEAEDAAMAATVKTAKPSVDSEPIPGSTLVPSVASEEQEKEELLQQRRRKESLSSQATPQEFRHSTFSETESAHQEKNLLLKALSGLWTMRSGAPAPQLEYPMAPTEHVFADSQVIVLEEEPSSIIAFTLSCSNYQEKMRSLAQGNNGGEPAPDASGNTQRNHSPAPSLHLQSDSRLQPPLSNMQTPAQLEQTLRQPDGTHLRFEFESGSSRLWCRIFYAEQFEALRRSAGCEESINESLSRCVPWDSAGGKSGAAFLKTRDDRLVVKQLSRYEMDAFSKFAPHYFQYMSACLYHDRPTTLAKIFGCFRFGFKNSQTGKSLKMDCVVLENLFYGKQMSNIWDLKGSTRNRHVQPTGRPNEVLQDENFLEMTYQNPLYVREHSKRILQAALWNDSLFLADMNVMDYSLVVGLDTQRGELVVGMIDIVRTFTWDKRVESFVKETGLLPRSGRGEPTVITPRQYRARFLAFLSRAFLLTPDPWLPPSWNC